ncbi:putative class I-like SAM-dependent O-methyltransferase [Helianthus anomalus]
MQYILETNVYPREPELLKELRALTASHPWAVMGTAPDAGQMIGLLLKTVGAKNNRSRGFYGLFIVAIDPNRETYEIGLPVIKKAKVEHKFDFIESKALPALDKMLENGCHGHCTRRRLDDRAFVKDRWREKKTIEVFRDL